jgi:FkbM family methyltransferase
VFEVLIRDGYHLADLAMLVPEPSHIIDIGAHVGSAALALARTWPSASITCVEPLLISAALLQQNVAANCLAASVVQAAAGARAGTGVLCEVLPGSCENKMATVPGERDVHTVGVSVPVVPMVDLLKDGAETGGATLVKLDCEGSEYELVSAIPLRAWECVSAVVMEYHPVPGHGLDELAEHLGEAGFTLVQCEQGNRPGLGQAWFVRPRDKTGYE